MGVTVCRQSLLSWNLITLKVGFEHSDRKADHWLSLWSDRRNQGESNLSVRHEVYVMLTFAGKHPFGLIPQSRRLPLMAD